MLPPAGSRSTSSVNSMSSRLASNRRSALVHHAVGTRLVTEEDLPLLAEEQARNAV